LFSPASRVSTPLGGLSSHLFAAAMLAFVVLFVGGWLALFSADVAFTNWDALGEVLRAKEIRAALWLSLWTSGLSVLLGLMFAIPMGYALSRYRFPGHVVVDSIVDLPILLPPLIIGLSLLVFFRTDFGRFIESGRDPWSEILWHPTPLTEVRRLFA
jgi:molybdate transport system permease protein